MDLPCVGAKYHGDVLDSHLCKEGRIEGGKEGMRQGGKEGKREGGQERKRQESRSSRILWG